MTIFVIGQCTLHWGRMEFGNIGNYYIIEPFFRELHRVFPESHIKTTFQMSSDFCEKEKVKCVPMNEYYGWLDNDLQIAYKELAIASVFHETRRLIDETPYIRDLLSSDLIIDFSGDIWGKNADFLGPNRFLIGLIKDRVAQLFGKPTAMIAGSPGPFNYDETLEFAHIVFSSFNFVSNREPVSREILSLYGFETGRVVDAACPAFLFEPGSQESIKNDFVDTPLEFKKRPVVGFILCGWNMLQGPFNRDDWKDCEFNEYVEALIDFIETEHVDVCFMSHSNGFRLPPHFAPIKGRDYPIVKQLYEIMRSKRVADHVFLMDDIYNPKETKAIISNFDMLISGRVHGAVAGLSQNIPTVIIDYGHEPKAHKLWGFAKLAGVDKYIANPADVNEIKTCIKACWNNRKAISEYLQVRNVEISKLVSMQFDALRSIL